MSLKLKLQHVMLQIALLVFVNLALGACFTSPSLPLTEQPTTVPARIPITQTKEVAPFPQVIFTPTQVASNTPESPKAVPTLNSFEVESGDPRDVWWAFWSDNGKTIYYAFVGSEGIKRFEWAAYDIMTHSATIVSSPLNYDPVIWKRLNVPEPHPNGISIELRGFVSPSGRRVIYTVAESGLPPRSEVWLADTHTLAKAKLIEVPNHGDIDEVIWRKDEAEVVFSYGVEASDLYIADIQRGSAQRLADISDFKDAIGGGFSVSPDGTTIAISDFQHAKLWLVSLDDGRARLIDQPVTYVHWSKDGKALYYDWGITSADIQEFRSYDIESSSISTLITHSKIEDIYFLNDFAVSPMGDKVLFWGGWLRLVDLRK